MEARPKETAAAVEKTKNRPGGLTGIKAGYTWHWLALLIGIGLIVVAVFAMSHPDATLTWIRIVIGVILFVQAGILFAGGYQDWKTKHPIKAVIAFIFAAIFLAGGVILLVTQDLGEQAIYYVVAGVFILDALANLLLIRRLWTHNPIMGAIAGVAVFITIAASILLVIPPEMPLTPATRIALAAAATGAGYLMFGLAALGIGKKREPVEMYESNRLEHRSEEA